MSFPGWSTTVFLFCDRWSWAVQLPAVLQKNPPAPAHSLVFQHLLHIWTLSNNDCMILRSIFSHWGQLRDSYTTITKGENIYWWCSRRQHNALRAGGVNFWTGWWCANTGLQKLHKYLRFPEDKISTIYPDHAIQNVYTPPALNASCCLLEHQYMFSPFVIVMHKSLNCPQC